MLKDYNYEVDIWSLGCLLAELQGMKKENFPSYKDRKPLFPGTSCQFMSPDEQSAKDGRDQLNVILEIIGTPTLEDCDFIGNKLIVQKLLDLPTKPKVDLSDMYPASDKLAIDLLNKMLEFNPHKRINIDECLEHPYLASVRKKEREISAPDRIVLEFPSDELLNEKIIRNMIIDEVEYFERHKRSIKI